MKVCKCIMPKDANTCAFKTLDVPISPTFPMTLGCVASFSGAAPLLCPA